MPHDYCLRFTDQQQADGVLFEGEEQAPRYAAIDVIGVIWKPTGSTVQTEYGEVEDMAPVPGWHVNVRHNEEAPELEAYQVFPQSPVRGWA